MKNVLDKFNNIVELASRANKIVARRNNKDTTGHGPRFRKMMHWQNKRVHSIGIFDYHTKQFVLFEMVNMVGQPKDILPVELTEMENLILNAKIA
jgi:hypothetical protein